MLSVIFSALNLSDASVNADNMWFLYLQTSLTARFNESSQSKIAASYLVLQKTWRNAAGANVDFLSLTATLYDASNIPIRGCA